MRAHHEWVKGAARGLARERGGGPAVLTSRARRAGRGSAVLRCQAAAPCGVNGLGGICRATDLVIPHSRLQWHFPSAGSHCDRLAMAGTKTSLPRAPGARRKPSEGAVSAVLSDRGPGLPREKVGQVEKRGVKRGR